MMKSVIILTSMLFMLFGCAAKKLVIRNADTMIEMAVTKRITVAGPGQRKELARDIDQLLNQYKAEARSLLPVVDELDLQSAEKTEKHYLAISGIYLQGAREFTGMLAKHLARLDSQGQKHFFNQLEKENKEIEKKELKERSKDFGDRLRWFFGTVTQQQKDLLASYNPYFKERVQQRLSMRRELAAKIKEAFAKEAAVETRQATLHGLLMDFQTTRLDDATNLEIIKKFRATLTEDQHKHFQGQREEVKELIHYFMQMDY
jgi:hypothetical protein